MSVRSDPFTVVILASSTTVYDNIGRVLKVSDQAGTYREFEYADATLATRALKTTFSGGSGVPRAKIAEQEQDENGNVLSSKTFDAGVMVALSTFEYDDVNRQIRALVHKPDQTVYSTSEVNYDKLGRRVLSKDPDGKATEFGYDALGRLRFVTNWLVQISGNPPTSSQTPLVTQYAYDEAGNSIKQKDNLGRETAYEYDNFGRRIFRKLPGGQTETRAYDVSTLSQVLNGGKLVHHEFRTDFKSQTTKLIYDVRDRLVSKGIDGSSPLITYTYTPWGARRTMFDPGGSTAYIYGRVAAYSGNPVPGTFSYDSDQLVIQQRSDNGTPASTDAILDEYDSRGNATRVNTKYTFGLSGGSTVSSVSAPDVNRTDLRYEYDGRNRLTKVRRGSDSGEIARYVYSDVGTLKETTYTDPNLRHSYAYNAANHLISASLTKAGAAVAAFDYNPTSQNDNRPLALSGQRRALRQTGPGVPARTVNFDYDSLNRLVTEDILSDTASSAALGTVRYTFDNVGNRLTRQSANGSSTLLTRIPNFSLPNGSVYDANDRLPSPEVYDANGNTLKGDLNGIAGVEQPANDQYDFEDRLITSTRTGTNISLFYDGDGNRTRKQVVVGAVTSKTRFVVDDRTPSGYAQVLEEWESVNGAAWTLARRYTYGLNRIRQERLNSSGTLIGTEYYGYDGHGNVVLLVNSSGTVSDTYSYDAYGVLLAQTGSSPNKYLYSGEQWDADLGLYYLRARYLNLQGGRFWTTDSFEGNQSDPLSLHKYLYTHDDPVNGVDPSGHEFSLLGVSIATTIGASLDGIYNGTVSGIGSALQASIFGIQAGKGMNEILTGFLFDETGIGLAVDGYQALRGYFGGDARGQQALELAEFNLVFGVYVAPWLMTADDEEAFEVVDEIFTPQCLVAGTPVETSEGLKAIEMIQRGDSVWAWNDQTGQRELKRVAHTFIVQRDEVVEIEVDDVRVVATPDHPFYTQDKRWKPAGQLAAGDVLFDECNPEGRVIRVVELRKEACTVYNMEVEGLHNFFVTSAGILTHNVQFNHFFQNSFVRATLGSSEALSLERKNPFPLGGSVSVSRAGSVFMSAIEPDRESDSPIVASSKTTVSKRVKGRTG